MGISDNSKNVTTPRIKAKRAVYWIIKDHAIRIQEIQWPQINHVIRLTTNLVVGRTSVKSLSANEKPLLILSVKICETQGDVTRQ